MTTPGRAALLHTLTLTLENFPRPDVAEILSPNGRPHHMARYRVTRDVAYRVKVEATTQGLRPMRGLVTLQATYVVPVARKRDQDNYTAILKSVVDAMVRGGFLPDGDDIEHLRLEPPVVRVERGRRMLVLEFETSDVATDRQSTSAAESSVPAPRAGSSSRPRGPR